MAKQKNQIEKVSSIRLAEDVRLAIIEAKRILQAGVPPARHRHNNVPAFLPNPDKGCEYFEFDVGQAHPGDPEPRGKRRLVMEVVTGPRQVREIYFSDSHYASGQFKRVVA